MADKKKAAAPKSNEEIVMGFNQLRQEQRQLANKISELEVDITEHRYVWMRQTVRFYALLTFSSTGHDRARFQSVEKGPHLSI